MKTLHSIIAAVALLAAPVTALHAAPVFELTFEPSEVLSATPILVNPVLVAPAEGVTLTYTSLGSTALYGAGFGPPPIPSIFPNIDSPFLQINSTPSSPLGTLRMDFSLAAESVSFDIAFASFFAANPDFAVTVVYSDLFVANDIVDLPISGFTTFGSYATTVRPGTTVSAIQIVFSDLHNAVAIDNVVGAAAIPEVGSIALASSLACGAVGLVTIRRMRTRKS